MLSAHLPRGCRVFTSDLRVRVKTTGLSTYPDAAVVCGKSQRADDDPTAICNPQLLLEVTSPSTEQYDRGEKLRRYLELPSVHEVLIVSHREPRVTLIERSATGSWSSSEFASGTSFDITSLGCRLSVDDIYREGLEDAHAVSSSHKS